VVTKYRVASRLVTVTGQPSAICRWNSGTTLPFDPSTFPKRTITLRVDAPRPLVQPAGTETRPTRKQHVQSGVGPDQPHAGINNPEPLQQDETTGPGDERRAGDGRGVAQTHVPPPPGECARDQACGQLRSDEDQPGNEQLRRPAPELAGVDDRGGGRYGDDAEAGFERDRNRAAPSAPRRDCVEPVRQAQAQRSQRGAQLGVRNRIRGRGVDAAGM
jgi:hypothetical protein